ncbi:MAG: hypothetical protein L0G99_08840 [Propionibacteriales bacterium]|nr:hypothetical protein [Propionibacteriales bacterium]
MCDPGLDLLIWLPESHAPLAEVMRAIPRAGSLVLQSWPSAVWLLEPEQVAEALAQQVPPETTRSR